MHGHQPSPNAWPRPPTCSSSSQRSQSRTEKWSSAQRSHTRLKRLGPACNDHLGQVSTRSTARGFLHQRISLAPSRSVLDETAHRFPSDPLIVAVAPPAASEAAPSRHRSAIDLYHDGDYWGALDAAETEAANRATASIALAAAMNIGDSPAAVRALMIVDKLAAPDRDQLLDRRRARLLRAVAEPNVGCPGPFKLADRLRGEWVDRPDLLSEWSRQWPRTPEVLERELGIDSRADTRGAERPTARSGAQRSSHLRRVARR